MRLHIFIIVYCLYFTCLEGVGQNNKITVNGIVVDKYTNEPLPFAHIQIDGNGTVTNSEGAFVMSNVNATSYLKVSFMGFVSDSILITRNLENIVIELVPSLVQMKEMMILTGEGLVKNLVRNISSNYQYEQQMWQAYYKEKLNDGSAPIYIAEGILDVYFPGNSLKYDWQISAVKSRKKTFVSETDIGGLKLTGNAHDMVQNLIWGDYSFLTLSRMKNFNFTYEGYSTLSGRNILIVSFIPLSKKEDVKGILYIDEQDYALVKATYEIDTRKSKVWETVEWEEEYQEIGGKWYFQRMGYKGKLRLNEKLISLESMFVINDIKIVQYQPAMGLLLEPWDFFFDEISRFSDDFWEEYMYVKLDKTEEAITKDR